MKKIYIAVALVFANNIQSAAHSQPDLDYALIKAAEACNVQEAARLITEGANVNAIGPYATPVLLNATAAGCLEIVDLLLNNGADANIRSHVGNALHIVFKRHVNPNKILPITKRLINAGTDVNAITASLKNTPLHELVITSGPPFPQIYALPAAFLLLKAGAQLDQKNGRGKTPLEIAYESGNTDMATLLEMYAHKNLQNRIIFSIAEKFLTDGSAEHATGERQLKELQESDFVHRNRELMRMLYLISGIDLNMALIEAAKTCNVEEAARLINAGADMNAIIGPTRTTALLEAAGAGCLEVVDLLLNKGAHANVHNASGNALHHTLRFQKKRNQIPAIVNRLTKAGTDVNATEAGMQGSPLHILLNQNIESRYALPAAFLLLTAGARKDSVDQSGHTPLKRAKKAIQNKARNADIADLIEMYPGRNLQERIIFSIAKRFYSDDPKVRALAESQLEQLQEAQFDYRDPYLNRMLYLIIGRGQKTTLRPAQRASSSTGQDDAPEFYYIVPSLSDRY